MTLQKELSAAVVKNYLTTVLGMMAGLPGIVLGVFYPGSSYGALSPVWTHHLMVTAGLGVVGLGIVSKAFNVHSTVEQVEHSTVEQQAESDTQKK